MIHVYVEVWLHSMDVPTLGMVIWYVMF